MAKVKIDFKSIKTTLGSRFEILGLVVAGVLVAICMVWGITTLLGAASPDGDIQKDVKNLQNRRMQSPPPKNPKPKDAIKADLAFTAWPPVKPDELQLTLAPVFERGAAGSSSRISPKILAIDPQFQMDYLHKGIHTYELVPVTENLVAFTPASSNAPNPNAKAEVEPVVRVAGKRMIVVSGTFQYDEQIENYRKALRLDKATEVFSKGFGPAFEGLNIERRKVIYQDGKPAWGDWEAVCVFDPETGNPIRVEKRIDDLLRTAVYDSEWVDKYYDVIYGAAAMPLPLLTNGSVYPEIRLEGIVKRPPPRVARPDPKSKIIGPKPSIPFHMPFGTTRSDRMPHAVSEIRPVSNVKFEDLPQDLLEQVSGKSVLFSPFGNAPEDIAKLFDPSKVLVKVSGGPAADENKNSKAPLEPPANPKGLIRFLDVDLQPGAIYQWRVQPRMVNPNYNVPEPIVAHMGVSKNKELVSDTWTETPPFQVPNDDVQYYITTQENSFVSRMPRSNKDPQPIDRDPKSSQIAGKMVPFQIHCFLDNPNIRDKSGGNASHQVADWSIAERLLVARGEVIGRRCDIELVVWKHLKSQWEIPGVPTKVKDKTPVRADGLAVDFRTNPPVMLLDFVGGKQPFKQTAKPFEEDSGIEALLLMPDLTMKVQKARDDVDDTGYDTVPEGMGNRAQERRRRFEEWKARLEILLNPQPPPTGPGKGLPPSGR